MVLLIKNWECEFTNFNFRTGDPGGKFIGIKDFHVVFLVRSDNYYDRIK